MAELKELKHITQNLSLLYIDENQKFLTDITTVLKKFFFKVDDASDAVLGLDYLKVNKYDLIILDSNSDIMTTEQLIENIRSYNKFQDIIMTTPINTQEKLLYFHTLILNAVVPKPFKATSFLDTILAVTEKMKNTREYLRVDIDTLEDKLASQKRQIGRFMIQQKELNKQIVNLENSVYIDKYIHELTKLPSRFALQEALDGREQSLIYINIDNFEFVNSTYGMGKANKMLKECSKKLKLFLPRNTVLYHITADEFVILIDDPSKDQAFILANQIQSLFKESVVEFDTYTHFVVFSMGIDSGNGKKLFINAKAASKEARYYFGNQIVIYNPYSDYMKEQRNSLYWIGVLKKAFDDDKIFTYYQPIITNSDSKIKHYEVLCRLLDENNILVDAGKFIHSAKQVGLITQITRAVIDKAFKLFTTNSFNFSINISMHDLHENYLLNFLEYKCKKYNITQSRVHLEIVEDIIMSETDILDRQIIDLKHKGYHVIVDDFGTDKSAYNRMFELEAEFIKIDGSFIKELSRDKSHQIIVKSIVDFAKKVE